jgi:hypothetical protein
MPVFPQPFGFQIGEFLVFNGLFEVFLTIFESGSILNIDSTHYSCDLGFNSGFMVCRLTRLLMTRA